MLGGARMNGEVLEHCFADLTPRIPLGLGQSVPDSEQKNRNQCEYDEHE